jgi:protein-tyrosine phosphatase
MSSSGEAADAKAPEVSADDSVCSECNKCAKFTANKFRKNICVKCQCEASKHTGLTSEEMITAAIARDDTYPTKIEDGLFIGSFQGSMNLKFLEKENITHVVNCAADLKEKFRHFKQYPEKGISYLDLDLGDDTSTDLLGEATVMPSAEKKVEAHLDENGPLSVTYRFIDDALSNNGHVLIHCAQGVSRSGAVLVAYLMRKNGISFEEAMAIVRPKRPIVNPNWHFQEQLELYGKLLKIVERQELNRGINLNMNSLAKLTGMLQ